MNNTFLITNVIGGLLVILSYVMFLPRVQKEYLWGNMTRKTQNLFWMSIVFSAICYMIGMMSIYYGSVELNRTFWLGLVMFFVGAMSWAVILSMNRPELVFLSLLLTTIGIWIMMVHSPLIIATMCFAIVFLHASLMDNVIWYSEYLETYRSK